MNRRRRQAALWVCLGYIAFLLMASAFIALEAGHDCAGEDCAVCLQVARMHALLSYCLQVARMHALLSHGSLLGLAFAAAFVLLLSGAVRSVRTAGPVISLSPVSLKVRMNN